MKTLTGKFLLAILLAAGMGNAFAWQGESRRQQWLHASEARRGDEGRRQGERGHPREGRQFEPQQQPANSFAPAEDPRRGGRMTPEERRELRRQINEAGRDLYVPRR